MANGAMTTNVKEEKEVRKILVDEGYIDCVVQLPEKLFFTTGIPCCLFFLSKNRDGKNGYRARRNKILFIDARKMGKPVSRKQKALSKEEIDKIASVYRAFKYEHAKSCENIEGFCKIAKLEEVQQNDYKLTPSMYVGTEAEEEEEDIPFEQKIAELTKRLLEQFEESNKLQEKIKQNLEELMYRNGEKSNLVFKREKNE